MDDATPRYEALVAWGGKITHCVPHNAEGAFCGFVPVGSWIETHQMATLANVQCKRCLAEMRARKLAD
jgi:hypothetical protein